MARTRSQSAAQRGPISSTRKDHGKGPQDTSKRRSDRRNPRYQGRPSPEHLEPDEPHQSPIEEIKQGPTIPDKRGTKRPADTVDLDAKAVQKKPRPSLPDSLVEKSSGAFNPVEFWARKGHWPREYFEPSILEHLRARKRSPSSLSRKRPNSASSVTPSDQKPREEKSAPYRDARYETLLGMKGSFMVKSSLDITGISKTLCTVLLEQQQTTPDNTLFRDDLFESTCQKIHNTNEARVIQDITRLIVPSAESLATFGARHLDILIESVNEGWNNSIPLTEPRPQPDYSVGFKREAFTDDQLTKLSPFIGDFLYNDQSLFMSTYYMYFPFLTCEVKCGAAALDIADRQNAHSMTLAVRGVVELFRALKREEEVDREILGFSFSHDHRSVRIYGHYAVIDGKDTKFYRHPIHMFDFTALEGKEKWTAYRFTKNVYDIWMPAHFKRICSAIDQLPAELEVDVPSLERLTQSNIDSASLPLDQDSLSSSA
ncbi:hypothetical protein ACRALDRAFT_1042065, partial [Sodiomyces alcalophilus JCM 7366]|uniref:uncharacterized protein n=1 Tax=Sodiomyces alcalophilus JCM 7366 TaxID=591952 RepID=UPI0039B614A8